MNNARNCVLGTAVGTFMLFLGSPAYSNTDSQQIRPTAGDSLTWTAPGDNASTGTAKQYDIRYSLSQITAQSFSSATRFNNAPTPKTAGTIQRCFVNRLRTGTNYYFAIKTIDAAGNWSPISNVISKASRSYSVGDANLDGTVNISDDIYIINYVFNNGAEPQPWGAGDVDCDAIVNISDVVYLLHYVMTNGPEPGANCP